MSGDEEDSTSKTRYYRLMLYAAIFRAFSSLVTVGYITLYNQGIKFFGQHGGLGVAQSQYAKTGDVNYRNLPGILLQGFIALWSGAAVGPEGTLVFLTGGLGTFVSERLKLQKDDIEVLAYSAIAGAFGIGILLLLMLVKILLTGTSFATGFEGGPIFPLLFIGGTTLQLILMVLPYLKLARPSS